MQNIVCLSVYWVGVGLFDGKKRKSKLKRDRDWGRRRIEEGTAGTQRKCSISSSTAEHTLLREKFSRTWGCSIPKLPTANHRKLYQMRNIWLK